MKPEWPTPELIAKLPKWAQDRIRTLERERLEALRALNNHVDNQKPSQIYWEEYLSTGEGTGWTGGTGPSVKRFYVQTNRVVVECAGVQLQVDCHEATSMHDDGIELKWSDPTGLQNMTAFVPTSFQRATLIAQHNMRVRPAHPDACREHKFRDEKFCTECGWRKQL